MKEWISFLTWTADWYNSLPKNKRYLLGGIKITGELGFGINNWYYPNGNSLYDMDSEQDPTYGIDIHNMPSRGVAQIGYASLKYSGIVLKGRSPHRIYIRLNGNSPTSLRTFLRDMNFLVKCCFLILAALMMI